MASGFTALLTRSSVMLEVFRKVAFRFGSRPRHVTTVEDGRRRSASRVEKVKATCDLGRMHARSMCDRSLAPELAANERKCYQLYKRDAIALARRVADPALRDRAIAAARAAANRRNKLMIPYKYGTISHT